MATIQTGAMVIRNGRMVSLAEWESRSNARKTSTVPYDKSTKPMASSGAVLQFISTEW